MRLRLQTRVFLTFVLVVVLFVLLCAGAGAIIIGRTVLAEAQRRVGGDLRSAWAAVNDRKESMGLLMAMLAGAEPIREACVSANPATSRMRMETARRLGELDFVSVVDADGRVVLRTVEPHSPGDDLSTDPFVYRALRGETLSGFAILEPERLEAEGRTLARRAYIAFEPTPKAKPRPQESEAAGMVLMAAAPIRDDGGRILGAVYGGALLNRNHDTVDDIRSTVFADETYNGKQIGAVTVFQWDVRIATNVFTADGNRAIGTRVSSQVYDQVLENGRSWTSRAFVVNDWYLSAYDPIRDVEGRVIGILYVGVLESRFNVVRSRLWMFYGALALAAALLVLIVGYIFSRRLTRSLSGLARAADRLAAGRLDVRVPEPAANDEVRDLTRDFNAMADRLEEREERLRNANASLQKLNSSYLEMLGFVSHELKNTLGVIYTAAHALSEGLVGQLTEPQARMAGSICRSIDTAVSMTRNYLSLARIEKGELEVDRKPCDFVRDVATPVLAEFAQPMADHKVRLVNELPPSAPLKADANLLCVAFRNLIGNALKYGRPAGTIRIGFSSEPDRYRVEVWNDGRSIPAEEAEHIFQKFTRLSDDPEAVRKGTGLGLFITREVVTKHGGDIWAEPGKGEGTSFVFTLPRDGQRTDAEV
mgnify:CR=1 FL=1